jgi:hypothetical protein
MPITYLVLNLEDEALHLSKDREKINHIVNENPLDWGNEFGYCKVIMMNNHF